MEVEKNKLKEMENYENNIFYLTIFGNFFLKNQRIFNSNFFKYFFYLLFIIFSLVIIFPIGQFMPIIIWSSVVFVIKIFIFFFILFLVSYLLSSIFKNFPKIKLTYFKNINILFYSILFLSNIFYIFSVLMKNEFLDYLNISYNLNQIALYSEVVELMVITLFVTMKSFYKIFPKIKNIALEHYYKNHLKMDESKKTKAYSILVKATKEIRIYLLVLLGLISLKFILFYEFQIYKYNIDGMLYPKIELFNLL